MWFKAYMAFALTIVFACTAIAQCGEVNNLVAHTTSGQLFGFVDMTTPQIRQFLGIPFAEPPINDLRFRPPQKYSSNETKQATTFAPNCMQDPQNPGFVLYRGMGMGAFLPSETEVYSEDCLYLNVYTPKTVPREGLPVVIWIHGGGFAIGSATVPYQIPDQWVERSQAHIVVTINYRLKIFGYPNSAAGTKNVGLLDQRAAVEWVRDNIAAFGGDPLRIVLWGQSAGAYSVNLYAMAYPHDPIARGLISNSGGDEVPLPDDSHGNFSAVAAEVGCGGLSATEEFQCVQGVNATKLVHTVDDLGAAFLPQRDEKTAFARPYERIRQGLVAKLPWIIGVTEDEGDATCWSHLGFQPRLDIGIPVYRYVYSGNFSNITPLPELGAAHSSELPLIFGTHYQFNHNSTEFEYNVCWTMQDLWLAFIIDPNKDPRSADYTWPRLTANDSDAAVFGLETSTAQSLPPSSLLNCTSYV